MYWAAGIRQSALRMLAFTDHRIDSTLQVTRVIHGIKDAEHVDTIFSGTLNKAVNHVIRIVAIAKQILTTQQHLLRGFRHRFFQFANTIPRIFAEETNTGIKGGAAPRFERPKTNVI